MSNSRDSTPKRRRDFSTRPDREFAVISKMVMDTGRPRTYDKDGNRKASIPDLSVLNAMSERTASVIDDINSMSQLLPDIELAAQILVSSILSPKDMGAPNVNFTVEGNEGDPELNGKMIKVISDYFLYTYKINDGLPEIVRNILFDKGSHIRMVVPESSLDEIINEDGRLSLESATITALQNVRPDAPLGLLADKPTRNSAKESDESTDSTNEFSMESLLNTRFPDPGAGAAYGSIGTYIKVVDNPDIAKLPSLFERVKRERVSRAMGHQYLSMEARIRRKSERKSKDKNEGYGNSDREIERRLEGGRNMTTEPVLQIKTRSQSKRESIGHPMVVTLPPESVIPAYIPTNPKEHIGYFVILDQFGNPINTSTAADHYRDLQASFEKSKSQVTEVLREMRGMGADTGSGMGDIQSIAEATNTFSDLIEQDLLYRLRSGVGNDSIEIAHTNEVYQIMLARACRRKQTQILYVPSELMSYMAFYYSNHGVGKSLLEETRILGSIRIMLMFANTMAAIRNSTQRTELSIELDPGDSDPMGTISLVRDAFMRSRAEGFPLGEGNPSSVVHYLSQYGVDTVYSGHPDLPNMKVESTDKTTSKTAVDQDLMEETRKYHIMGLGISPETIDVSAEVDFATSLVNSSLLLSKRIALYQNRYEALESDYVQKYTINSETLMTKLYDIVVENGDKDAKDEPMVAVEKFVKSIRVNLPKPDTITLESRMEAYDQYSRALDEAINAWVSEDIALRDVEGDVSTYLREVREAIKAYYLRRWLRDNNVLPELEEITQFNDDKKPVFDFGEVQGAHMDAVYSSIESYLEKAKKATEKREERERKREEKRMEREQEGAEVPATGTPSAAPESAGDDGLGGGGDEPPADEATADDGGDDGGFDFP